MVMLSKDAEFGDQVVTNNPNNFQPKDGYTLSYVQEKANNVQKAFLNCKPYNEVKLYKVVRQATCLDASFDKSGPIMLKFLLMILLISCCHHLHVQI